MPLTPPGILIPVYFSVVDFAADFNGSRCYGIAHGPRPYHRGKCRNSSSRSPVQNGNFVPRNLGFASKNFCT
eukprot:3602740-Rhodomonas_salina.1